jgi:phosphoserine phosphatase
MPLLGRGLAPIGLALTMPGPLGRPSGWRLGEWGGIFAAEEASERMRPYDLICFDVDGTLVIHPEGKIVWEILNRRFIGDESINLVRYRDFKRGAITYADWVALDVGGWLGAKATRAQVLEAIAGLRLIDGARATLDELKRRGYKLAVVSGTLDIVLDTLFPDHPFDDVFANSIRFDDEGFLCGWTATPYDVEGKAQALRKIAAREGIALARCASVGDAFNDIEIARESGFAIALNSSCRELIEVCGASVVGDDLGVILSYFP